jgi:S-adenosylmethionine:tRNA ribosyltransferase-isomerase
VYAAAPGAIAAPTAGLHFTEEILTRIQARGTALAQLTLHVGIGTFKPVAVESVADHVMHAEWFEITDRAAAAINSALDEDRRIVCVGTTTVRALEASLSQGEKEVVAGEAWTDIFITPGFAFRGTGALLTNFHLPKSTLMMMVSALASPEMILAAYNEAVSERYRFYSYGDAMLIT